MEKNTMNYNGVNTLALDVNGTHLKVGDVVKIKKNCECEWTVKNVPNSATIREVYDNGNINLDVGTDLFPNVDPLEMVKQ